MHFSPWTWRNSSPFFCWMSSYNYVMVTIWGMVKGDTLFYLLLLHRVSYRFDVSRGDYALTNHILLVFKRAIYELRLSKAKPSINFIKHKLKITYKIEAEIAEVSSKLDSHYKNGKMHISWPDKMTTWDDYYLR